MSLEWNFWYALWMIQDGLPNRSVGDEFSWDIEFAASKLSRTNGQRKSAVPRPDYKNQVVAEVRSIYANAPITERACVIDFGLKVIGDPDVLPVGCKPGDYVCGEMTLSATHGHAIPTEESFECLRRKWHLNAIQADLTPFIQHPEHRYFMRDESRVKYQSVWSTDTIKAENYVLHCSEIL